MKYYGSLCTQIYDLDKPEPAQNELEFYLKYINKKEMQILEPMCGSGRFLIPILERGYQIDGFDVSEDMLRSCEQKARMKKLNCHLKVVKVEDFISEKQYDLIMIPAGSLGVITEQEKLMKSLVNFHTCLRDEGKLLLEILTPAFFMNDNVEWIESNRKVREDGKEIVQYSKSTYDEENRILSWPLKYNLVDGEKVIETEEMELLIKLYFIEELKELLAKVGFKTERVLKDYTDEAATEADQVVVFEVSKV